MKLDISLFATKKMWCTVGKERATWRPQNQGSALFCSDRFQVSGTSSFWHLQWHRTNQIKLDLQSFPPIGICLCLRKGQPIMLSENLWTMVACNPLITQLPTERWRTSHIYNYRDHLCNCRSLGQEQYILLTAQPPLHTSSKHVHALNVPPLFLHMFPEN